MQQPLKIRVCLIGDRIHKPKRVTKFALIRCVQSERQEGAFRGCSLGRTGTPSFPAHIWHLPDSLNEARRVDRWVHARGEWLCGMIGEIHSVFLTGRSEGKRPLWRPRCRWLDRIEMDPMHSSGSVAGCCEHSSEPVRSWSAGWPSASQGRSRYLELVS